MNKFLLLLGPSAVGKSSIIRSLRETDQRYVYISPYITRPLREAERDKVSVSDSVMDEMAARGDFLKINQIYGIRYATPLRPIQEAFNGGMFPVLDWPVNEIEVMAQAFGNDRLLKVYVFPPSMEELKRRVEQDGRDVDGSRFKAAIEEIRQFQGGTFDSVIDFKIESTPGYLKAITMSIHGKYLESVGEFGWDRERRE